MMGTGVMTGPGMMWGLGSQGTPPSMPGWMWGLGMAFGWLAMLAFWGILIVGLVLLVRWLTGAISHTGTPPAESPLEILKRRYAGAEIDGPPMSACGANSNSLGPLSPYLGPQDPVGHTD